MYLSINATTIRIEIDGKWSGEDEDKRKEKLLLNNLVFMSKWIVCIVNPTTNNK